MKRLTTFLMALLLITLGASAQSTWTAPQPTTSSLTSGNQYYLYNVGYNGFLVNGNDYLTRASVGPQGLVTTVTSATDGWTIMFASVEGTWTSHTNCYLYYIDGALYCDQDNDPGTTGYFNITEASGQTNMYTIVSTSASTTYVGWDSSDGGTIVSPVIAEVGVNTYWQFITAANYEVYLARLDLYDVLVEAEELGMTDSDTAYKDAGDVYTSNTSTVDEINAAIEALELAMEGFASPEHPVDVTHLYITNPDFDTSNVNGWADGSSFGYHTGSYTNEEVSIDGFAETWVSSESKLSNTTFYQTLTLPKGTYRLEVDAIATQQGDATITVSGVYLFAGIQATSMHTADGKPEHYAVEFYVTDEEGENVDVGVKISGTTANWVAVDNFLLYYLGEDVAELKDTESDYKKDVTATIYGHSYNVLSDNMVENHSFELGFEGWTNSYDYTEITSSNFELLSDEANDGERYLVGISSAGASAEGSLGKAWAIETGKTYYFSYWIKNLADATNTEYLKTSLTNNADSGNQYSEDYVLGNPASVSETWQKVEYLFTNSDYAYVQVKFRWLESQWGFDNFQLYQVEPAEDVLEGVVDDSEYKTGDEVTVTVDGTATTFIVVSDNMFVNGGFNADMYGWTEAGYILAADPSNFDVETTGGFNGGAYLVDASAGTGSVNTPSQAIAVENGKTYLFIGYTSGETPDGERYSALFEMSDATTEANHTEDDNQSYGNTIIQLEWGAETGETSDEWTQTIGVFEATTDYVGMRMGWSAGSYDGFQLYEVEEVADEVVWEMTTANWGTLILPFDVAAEDVPEDLTIYTCDGTETDEETQTTTVTVTEVEDGIVANTPYLVKGNVTEDTSYTFSGTPVEAEGALTEGLLTGTFVDMDYTALSAISGTVYLLQKHTEEDSDYQEGEGLGVAFYPVTEDSAPNEETQSEGASLTAYHCYLTLSDAAPAKLSIGFVGGEETGIVAVEETEVANDAIYDLAGRRVSKAVKGVYIMNGKKVLVK